MQEKLASVMDAAFRATWQTAEKYRVSPREAAFILAVERVAEATRLRGF